MLIAKLSLALLIASHRAFNLLWNRDFESFLVKFKDFDVRKAIPTRQLVNSVDYLYRSKSGQARFRPVRQSPETPDWAEIPCQLSFQRRPGRLRSRATRHSQRCLSLRLCKGVDHRDRAVAVTFTLTVTRRQLRWASFPSSGTTACAVPILPAKRAWEAWHLDEYPAYSAGPIVADVARQRCTA